MGNGDRRACSVRLALEHDVLKRVSPAAVVKFLQDEVECDEGSIKCVQTDKDGSLIVTFESVDYVEHILSLGTLTINGYPVVVTNVDARRKYVKVYYLPYEVSNREVHVALGEFGHVYHIRRDMMMNHPEIETGGHFYVLVINNNVRSLFQDKIYKDRRFEVNMTPLSRCLARRQQDYQLHGKMYGTDRTKQIPDITREPR
ncbi:hypothetical protein QZH41_000761 [Actinostola sp. cb2023]|nr:hypothetical protein QZH41_000761 [Actinostola sp. cb2023]